LFYDARDLSLFQLSVFHVLVLQSNDPSQQGAQAALKFLPLLIGYFALSVPSGLSLYW
jgi:membrane protein insertase Oxa1/YidC/SpoIIIJ